MFGGVVECRHARFRLWWRKPWGFESLHPYNWERGGIGIHAGLRFLWGHNPLESSSLSVPTRIEDLVCG